MEFFIQGNWSLDMSKWYIGFILLCMQPLFAEEEVEWEEESEECQNNLCKEHGRGCNYTSDYYHCSGIWEVCDDECVEANRCGYNGVWLPEGAPLFRQYIADPRQITYSMGWRFNDQVLAKNVIAVSFADIFSVYKWCCVGPWGGQLEIGIEGAVWATFAPLRFSSPLLNADYYVGVPIYYAIDCWAFRLRGYHISSHIGDEFLLENPGFDRRNPSAEYLEFSVSNQFSQDLRFYGGAGYVVHQDRTFRCSRFFAHAGVELRMTQMGVLCRAQKLYGVPFYAMHWRYQADFKHHVDMTYALGYEIGKVCGQGRKVRMFVEYHDGYSVEGQFCKLPTNYLALRATYGF